MFIGVAALAIAALIAGITVVNSTNTANGPEAVVRDYLKLIASGKAEAANKMVNPKLYSGEGELDMALLSDKVLRSASERIANVSAHFDGSDAELRTAKVGGTVDIAASYEFEGTSERTTIRVKRLQNSWGPFESWTIIDPLLVSVHIETNQSVITSAKVAGVRVPTNDTSSHTPPVMRSVLMYPGVYDAGGDNSTYFTAQATTIAVRGESGAMAWVSYQATPALMKQVDAFIPDHVNACVAAGASMKTNCPVSLWVDRNSTIIIEQMPVTDIVDFYRGDQKIGGRKVQLSFSSNGGGHATVDPATGERLAGQSFRIIGRILLDGDTVTVSFIGPSGTPED